MNFSQIKTLAGNFSGDPSQSRYTTQQYQDAINRAQEQFCFDTKALYKDASTYTVVDGTAAYDLPSDFWLEKMVTHKGLELKPITRAELLKNNGDDWTDDEGTPRFYIIDPEEARKQIRLYPQPQADDAGANLILTYYPIPAEISGSSDTPFNSSSLMAQFHLAVAALAAWFLLSWETSTPEIVTKMSMLMKQYEDRVTLAIDTFGNTKSSPINIRGGYTWR